MKAVASSVAFINIQHKDANKLKKIHNNLYYALLILQEHLRGRGQ